MYKLGINKKFYQNLLDNDKVSQKRFEDAQPDVTKSVQLERCQVPEHRYHITKSKDGYIIPECTPDTLYSWGNWSKTAWFFNNLPANAEWKTFPRSLFTTPSAAATFGYGPIPLRFKVKPNVKFRLIVNNTTAGNCNDYVKTGLVKKSEFDNTVFVRLELRNDGVSFADYIICSGAVLESWSFLRPEHYDEISLDYQVMTGQHFYKWEGYSKQQGHDDFLNNTLDVQMGTDFTLQTYSDRVHFIRTAAALGLGKIFFQGQASENKPRKDADHFKTNHGNYFNPK